MNKIEREVQLFNIMYIYKENLQLISNSIIETIFKRMINSLEEQDREIQQNIEEEPLNSSTTSLSDFNDRQEIKSQEILIPKITKKNKKRAKKSLKL